MNRLKLRHLHTFLEVYRRRKIAVAAERLCMTQSAVSITLRQLEDIIGVPLFDRTTRALHPTEAAFELLPIAERMLRDTQTVESMFRVPKMRGGRFSVVSTPTFAQTMLPILVGEFLRLNPEVHVDILDVLPSQFVPVLTSGQADLGIGFIGHEDTELKQHRLLADHLCLVTSSSSPLLTARSFTWRSIQSVPLALIQTGYGIRVTIDKTALANGISLTISHEVGLLSTALAMTSAGITNTIAPAKFARMPMYPGLIARKLQSPVVKRDISAVIGRGRTLSLQARLFLDHCVEALRESK